MPFTNHDWVFTKTYIELYAWNRVNFRKELEALSKTNSKIFEKVITCANGEKDGVRIPRNTISKWLLKS